MSERYPGCHGVLVAPDHVGLSLGWVTQRPPRRVRVDVVDRVDRPPGGELLWWMERQLVPEQPAVRAEMWRQPDGLLWFGNRSLSGNGHAADGPTRIALVIDEGRGVISVAPAQGNEAALAEVLASVALPAFAQGRGSLVLHASACSRGGQATLIAAPGGSGKSTLLLGLVAAGWDALAEDQCVIDAGEATVWPAANWVRVRRGADVPAPIGRVRFWALDKIGWDLDPWMSREPAHVSRVVFLEPPGAPRWEPVPPAVVIGMLARQSPWHHGFAALGEGIFPQLVDFAMQVPAYRLRLPHSAGWVEDALTLLDAGPQRALSRSS